MSGFKLLSIRPLEGCDEKFLKNLKEGVVYKFYQDYKFYVNHNNEEIELDFTNFKQFKNKPISIIKPPKEEIDLYSKKNDLKINVSAVVGKNGSGKSSLVEFFNLAIYKLTTYSSKLTTIESLLYKQEENNKTFVEIVNNFLSEINRYFNSDFIKLEYTEDKKIKWEIESLMNIIMSIDKSIDLNSNSDKSKMIQIISFCQYELSEKLDIEINVQFFYIEILLHFLRQLKSRIKQLNEKLDQYKFFEEKLISKLNVEICYSQNGEIKIIHIDSKESKIMIPSDFYTILLNYSNNSFNSNVIGDWIKSLFHKNDGYKTPIVLNPFRDNGDYSFEKEFHLLKERIVLSITKQLIEKREKIHIGKYQLKKIICKAKHNVYYEGNLNIKSNFSDNYGNLLNIIRFNENLGEEYIPSEGYDIKRHLIGYLIRKYNTFNKHHLEKYFDKNKSPKDINWEFFYSDKTHLTKKFRTTANFYINFDTHSNYFEKFNGFNQIELDINTLKSWSKAISKNIFLDKLISTEELLENMFPSIFELDYIFEYDNKEIEFSGLSSGELQSLINIQTILYHTNNICSVHKKNNNSPDNRIPYDNINIILDEVELYYHPDFQRNFVFDIIDSLNKSISNGKTINGINILLFTHSPFILSDISSNNILRLEDGKPSKKSFEQTFGANIHDLLANDFFLKDGFMGEFAKEKINETIGFINDKKRLDQLNKTLIPESEEEYGKIEDKKSEKAKKTNKKIEEYKSEREELSSIEFEKFKQDFYSIIKLIGEPALRGKVREMFYNAFPEIEQEESYEIELSLLKQKYNKK